MKKIIPYLVIFILIYYVLLKLASSGYNTYTEGDYHSTLHADPAGYNVYLTALTPYDFQGKFPDEQDKRCGYGFTLGDNKKVITKYNYGVAFMQSPFYLIGKYIAYRKGDKFTGYDPYSQRLVDMAGIFYGLLGLVFLFLFLKEYVNPRTAFLSVAILFLSGNIFWYTVIQPGMSHVYSFFLFSLFLYLGSKYFKHRNIKVFILLAFTGCFILLIRMFNGIFLPIVLFLPGSNQTIKKNLAQLVQIKNILVAVLCLAVVFIPQIVYWKFAYNSYFPDTYPNEKFTNLASPKINALLFAAKSGLVMYNPIYLVLFPLILWFAIKTKQYYFWVAGIIYVGLIYLTASWYEYFFGCGFGNRNFAEYSVLLAFPIAYFFTQTTVSKWMKYLFGVLVIISVFVNLKLTESFDMCFFGKDIWDYREYKYLLLNKTTTIEIDYEKESPYIISTNIEKDPDDNENKCALIKAEEERGGVISVPVEDIGFVPPRKMQFSADICPLDGNVKAIVVLKIVRDKQEIFVREFTERLYYPIYQEIKEYVDFPGDLAKGDIIELSISNKDHHTYCVDSYKLNFK